MIEIKHRYTNKVLYRSKTATAIKEALEEAVDSESDLRWSDLRGANLRGANLGGADLSESDLRWSDLRRSNLRGADLSESDLRWSDLRRSNLRGADLSAANLGGANLSAANLGGANLSGANLSGSDLSGTDLLQIHASPYSIFCTGNDWVQIGCKKCTITDWLENYEAIGKKHEMSDEDIARYRRYLDVCKAWFEAKR